MEKTTQKHDSNTTQQQRRQTPNETRLSSPIRAHALFSLILLLNRRKRKLLELPIGPFPAPFSWSPPATGFCVVFFRTYTISPNKGGSPLRVLFGIYPAQGLSLSEPHVLSSFFLFRAFDERTDVGIFLGPTTTAHSAPCRRTRTGELEREQTAPLFTAHNQQRLFPEPENFVLFSLHAGMVVPQPVRTASFWEIPCGLRFV